jgi:hypothetical protein
MDAFMIEKEIEKARRLYAMWEGDLFLQKGIADDLTKFRNAVSLTHEQMGRAGVIQACSLCAAGSGGSCCFHGAEDGYDDVLLLINLLLGVALPEEREVPDGCFFVGGKGCRLLARHAFCVNYLCPVLSESLDPFERSRLLSLSGDELLGGWELEKTLRRWVRNGGK